MTPRIKSILPLALLVLLLGTVPATGQQCDPEGESDVLRDLLSARVSGTGVSWTDVFSRLIAQVDSLDLESGETSTVLTWNIDQHLVAKTSIVNEPELFKPLKEAIGDDADLLSQLSDQVGQGDDWQVSVDYNFQSENTNLGTRTVARKAVEKVDSYRRNMRQNMLAGMEGWESVLESTLAAMPCSEKILYNNGIKPALSLFAANYKPKALTVNAFFRSRDELAGQDEMGASLKYTYGLNDGGKKRSDEDQRMILMAGMVQGISSVPGLLNRVAESARQAMPAIAPNTASPLQVLNTAFGDPLQTLRTEQENLPAMLDRRLLIEVQWKQKDEYTFSSQLPNPLTLPKDESLTLKLAYSLQFKKDGKILEDRPRFELNLSYEDVDNDATRQSRFIAKAIASQKVDIMGDKTELTAGLVYANKPEFLADQEFDEQLSANLGLTFKIGSK